jgi:Uma2 family endonuclease
MDAALHSRGRLTVDEYAALPDDGVRTELVRGRVVREPQPGYAHAHAQVAVAALLKQHLRAHAPHLECVGNFGVITEADVDTVRGPDLAVLRRERAADLHRTGFLRGAPDLAIEIRSPSNTLRGTRNKAAEYLAAGAALVWVIDPGAWTVTVYTPAGEPLVLRAEDVLDGGAVMPEFRVQIGQFFEGS